MKVTTKGQVTIPRELRDKFGLLPHTEIEFVEQSGRVVLRKAADTPSRGQRAVERLRGRAEVKMTTDQIMKLTRG